MKKLGGKKKASTVHRGVGYPGENMAEGCNSRATGKGEYGAFLIRREKGVSQ